MTVIGMNSPHSMQKQPAVVIAKSNCRKIRISGHIELLGLGGRRDRIRRFAIITRNKKMKARMRMLQAQPRVMKSCSSDNGKTTPPTLPPVAARPVATPRFLAKKWAMLETAGVKIRAVPSPLAKEIESKKCQYSGPF